MPLTIFLELGHLFSVFNVVRVRRYPFQADLDNVTALQTEEGVVLPIPSPSGVPVKIRSLGTSVVPLLEKMIVCTMLKAWSPVELLCISVASPFLSFTFCA